MDFLGNVLVSGEYEAPTASLDDLFPTQNTEVDVSLEWLSIFVEDCFSSTGNCIPLSNVETKSSTTTKSSAKSAKKPHRMSPAPLQKFAVPGKARSKRKRVSKTRTNPFSSWKEDDNNSGGGTEEEMAAEVKQQPRRCSHCLAQRTTQWRAGPLGPKTLCNACGVRYKSGRLLPEYRPAKSPTFVSYLHSNSHKKVMEMRMSLLSSTSSE
ncbi:HNH endonuclease [Hibiscus syriacus]|uniref:HNH endonuclease n=1 Tax=Hibiscus syriacus TaxID=106335 RepID=A0A6A3CG60_HIBSY|nr:HNH endonuclease [Hibiscus syriacus]